MVRKTKKKNSTLLTLNTFVCSFLFLILTFVYLKNITGDIFGADVGDLVTAAFVGGIPHPPGYPLFTFLGFILIHLPFPLEPVSRVALISAFASLIGLFLYYKYAQKIGKSLLISVLSTLILAFSYLFWMYAEIPEVFALNAFFAVLLFYISFLFYSTKKIRYFYFLVFFVFLSLTHHYSIVFIFPGISVLVLWRIKIIFHERYRLFFVPFIAILGLFPLLYIPIAASKSPIINWDNAVNINNFLQLILRKDYVWKPGVGAGKLPLINASLILRYYVGSIISALTIPSIFIIMLGVVGLFKRDKVLFASIFGIFLICGPVAIFYISPNITFTFGVGIIERFFILSSVILALFIPFGLITIKDFINKYTKKPTYSLLILLLLFLIPVSMFIKNYESTNLSESRLLNNYAKDVLNQLPPNTLFFTYGDVPTFGIWYVHFVLGVRPDVLVVPRDPGNGGPNPFWSKELTDFNTTHPKIKDKNKVLSGVIAKTANSRPVYAVEQYEMPKSYIWIRKGMVYELLKTDNIPSKNAYLKEIGKLWGSYHVPEEKTLLPSERNFISTEVLRIYSYGFSYTGNFIDFAYRDLDEAAKYYRRAIEIDKKNPEPYGQLGIIELLKNKNCSEAEHLERIAISYSFAGLVTSYPYYSYLYHIFQDCHENDKLDQLKKEYTRIFHKDLSKFTRYVTVLRY